jgi:hypothetical protein
MKQISHLVAHVRHRWTATVAGFVSAAVIDKLHAPRERRAPNSNLDYRRKR